MKLLYLLFQLGAPWRILNLGLNLSNNGPAGTQIELGDQHYFGWFKHFLYWLVLPSEPMSKQTQFNSCSWSASNWTTNCFFIAIFVGLHVSKDSYGWRFNLLNLRACIAFAKTSHSCAGRWCWGSPFRRLRMLEDEIIKYSLSTLRFEFLYVSSGPYNNTIFRFENINS